MWIHISGWHIIDLGTLNSLIVTGWRRWCSGQRWCPFWCQLPVSVGRRCRLAFTHPAFLRIHCSAVLARKAGVHVILMKHRQGSFYPSIHLSMPRKLHSQHVHFSDVSAEFVDEIVHLLHRGARKSSFGHFGHDQGQVRVGLFQLCPTSLPCHSSRHAAHLQGISCCLKRWDTPSVSNGSIFGPFLLWRFHENLDPAGSVRVSAQWFPQLSPWIFIP